MSVVRSFNPRGRGFCRAGITSAPKTPQTSSFQQGAKMASAKTSQSLNQVLSQSMASPASSFVAGGRSDWRALTSDPCGTGLPLGHPGQQSPTPTVPASQEECYLIESEIHKLLQKREAEEVSLTVGQFVSHIVGVPKKDDIYRPVFNLKPLLFLEKISQVCVARQNHPAHLPSFWPVQCAESVHKASSISHGISQTAGLQMCNLSR